MAKVCIIGSSEIVIHHIKAMMANNIELHSICSTRKGSTNSLKLKKRFRIPNHYNDWKECVKQNSKKKDIFFLVCSRVKDSYKIIEHLVKRKLKVFSEKPLSLKTSELKKLKKYDKFIFIGYNRIFYKSLKLLSRTNIRNSHVNITCPEISKRNFLVNSCHIVSIIVFLFGNIKMIKKVKNKDSTICLFIDNKNNLINFNINFNCPTNFSISIKSQVYEILLCPIEKMYIYKSLKLKKIKNLRYYEKVLNKELNEHDTNHKPGFYEQYRAFKKSVMINKKHKIANIDFSLRIMNIAKKMIN